MQEIKITTGNKEFYARLIMKEKNEVIKLAKRLKMNEQEIEDLTEEQRPNILTFEDYTIITLLFPTTKTIKDGERILQITFIITNKGINIITNENNEIVTNSFNEIKKIEIDGITGILSHMIDRIREKSIELFEKFEEYLNKKEREIIQGKKDKRLLIKMHDLKENFYYILSTVNGNLTVIQELITKKIKHINPKYFSEHQEDRALYFQDMIEYLRESIRTNIETYLSLLTHQTNERIYKLTIIGSLLIIPTVLSGLFGMNVTLPPIGFWEIILLSIALSGIIYWFIK